MGIRVASLYIPMIIRMTGQSLCHERDIIPKLDIQISIPTVRKISPQNTVFLLHIIPHCRFDSIVKKLTTKAKVTKNKETRF